MKNILFVIAFGFILASCGEDTTKTMTVTGNVKGLKKGILYLQHVPDSTLIAIDSIKIEGDGNFTFKTQIESPEIFFLYLNKKDNNTINDRIKFFGEPGTITINTTWNTFDSKAEITGSKTQKDLEEYQKNMTRFNIKGLSYISVASKLEIQKDSIALDSLQSLSNKNVQKTYAYSINYALNHNYSYIAPYIALNEIPDANIKYLDSINTSLADSVAISKYGKELNTYLEKLKKQQ